MYFYSATSEPFTGDPVPYHRQNATKRYLTHYGNLMFLQFVVAESQDRAERQQATLEIPMCEKKLKHWTHHANYDHDEAMRGVDRIKKEWAGRRSLSQAA